MTVTEAMSLIQQLDPNAHINYSPYTDKWYVSADLWVSDGTLQWSPTEHRATPEEAVLVYLHVIQTITKDQFLIIGHGEERKEYNWNGKEWDISDVIKALKIKWAQEEVNYATSRLQEAQEAVDKAKNKLQILELGNAS